MKLLESVTGSKGDTYFLYDDSSRITCTCPAAKFRREDCKHVRKWKADNPDWQSTLPPPDDDIRDAKWRFMDSELFQEDDWQQ